MDMIEFKLIMNIYYIYNYLLRKNDFMKKYFNFKDTINYDDLKYISKLIKDGKIVIFPTETVYGIGTNAFNEDSISKLYKIKKRPLNKPISLLVSNIKMVKQVVKNINKLEYELMENFFPGPLTIIFEKNNIVPDIVTSGTKTVGIRMPSNEIALKLIEYANTPIATTSANLSGNNSSTDLMSVYDDFHNDVDFFIDDKSNKIGIPSTIINVIDNKIKILRHGSITKDDLEKFAKVIDWKSKL